ncbi:MAG: hypothetical protein IV107_16340 [Paucibacter sp.]|nr:hypothetical protein [Roseateles sp.]
MKLHAYRRNATEKIEVDFMGKRFKFAANDVGQVVGEVPDEIATELLKVAGDGYCELGTDPADAAKSHAEEKIASAASEAAAAVVAANMQPLDTEALAAVAAQFSVTDPNGEVFNLGPMTDEEVREFAEKAGAPKPHHTKKGDKLKLAVIESLKAQ